MPAHASGGYGSGRAHPMLFFFSSRRRHTRSLRDWSSDVCSSDLLVHFGDLCNREGWFAWRRQNLDGRYPARVQKPGLDDADFYASLDEFAANEGHQIWMHHWVEECGKRGDPPGRVIETAARWLEERETFAAFQVAVQVL